MEIWKDIEGYEGLYQISNAGRVKRIKGKGCRKDRFLKASVDVDGYLRVDLCKNNIARHNKIHILVAKAFIPNPHNLPIVRHTPNDDKNNNNVNNLSWGYQYDNMQDKVSKNRQSKGENHGMSTLTEKEVIEIRNKITGKRGERIQLAKEYNVTPQNISSIKNYNTWKHI
jgi:hypothetical protein